MDTLKNNKGTLIAIAVFVVVILSYNFFFKSDTTVLPSELTASSIGNDLIKMRAELQAVTLSPKVFSSSGFLLLTDFSTDIPSQPIGRPNPFNIIGRD
ncbi:MAG: hypothetical protein HYX23_01565 [Candidatus Zambryskibacteria bacterium]|nr:hypothetical protein [Candidatus Zambryskibacteria bacterium]